MRTSTKFNRKDCNHYSSYAWSNERYTMYAEMLSHIRNGKRQINHLLSVGGGDHVLFALSHLGSVERLTHIDVSAYSIAGALSKFAVILKGNFEDWYAFVHMSLPASFVLKCLDDAGFSKITTALLGTLHSGERPDGGAPDLFYGLNRSDNRKLAMNKESFFLRKEYFDVVQKRLKAIKRYDLMIHDIWTVKVKDVPDMALLSNAYHNDGQPNPADDFLVRKGGYIIYTECDKTWFPASWKRVAIEDSGDWYGQMFKRIK